jgi:preprotein translocase subunit SecE
MSEEKKTPAKKAEPGKGAKILNWFKTLPQRIVKPFRNMYYELKKVTWPSKERLISYSTIVLCFMLVMGVVIGLLDMGASAAVRGLISASSSTETTTTVSTTEETADDAAADAAEQTEEAVTDAAEKTEEAVTDAAEKTEEVTTETTEGTADAADEGK